MIDAGKRFGLRSRLRQQRVTENACCQHCGSAHRLTIDHIVPKTWAKGFNADAAANIQVLCLGCQRRKHSYEQKIQNEVMKGRLSRLEAYEACRTFAPNIQAPPSLRNDDVSKYLWQHKKTFWVGGRRLIVGITFFAKRLRDTHDAPA